MMNKVHILLLSMFLASTSSAIFARNAVDVLAQDYAFPNKINGFPEKLSDFKGLEIKKFKTSDQVNIAYWEAGKGTPLVFIPGWSANGAEFINIIYLLSKHYHVYVIDPRNQGLSDQVDYGSRISRLSMDLKEFLDHNKLEKANLIGWSMGASIIWGYIDLFGTDKINKLAFIDEPVSIYAHADWTEERRLNLGAMTTSPERMIAAFTKNEPTNQLVVDMNVFVRYQVNDSLYFQNSEEFAQTVIQNSPEKMSAVLFDHATNNWEDVIKYKINVPTAIFTGIYSNNVQSQKWMNSMIKHSKLFIYDDEHADHFLAFKDPIKFSKDLGNFIEAKEN
ncbi:alpha/beta hydrolase [Acinetobacter populi]|uniref:Alpha/beta hydrolase n=1 Tax=Acinetobacter populi TaxID=1582270 RepID=A0A1Z9YVI3_9GAMM|nr:alpha/beta hydrolase [Acinetobacter populi]